MEDDFVGALDTKSAAKMLGLAAATLEKMRIRGGGPFYYKLSRAVRYDPRDIAAWRSARRVASTSDDGRAA